MGVARLFIAAAILSAQPVRVDLNQGFALEAEYMVHSAAGLIAEDYLVVEVALTGPKTPIRVSSEQFTLRINNQKFPILTESPGAVASSIKYPDWRQTPTVTGTVGVGNDDVIIGPRSPVSHFPGDPTVHPPPPTVPPAETPGVEKQPTLSIEQRIADAALPEGDQRLLVRGLIFFQFHGKTKSIKSLELLYEGPAGKGSIKLQ